MVLIWGAIAGAVVSAYAAYRQNKKRQDYAERMSNTAHQREVADLRAAGLNPILSANRGASSPDPSRLPMGQNLGKNVMAARQLKMQQGLVNAQIEQAQGMAHSAHAKAIKTHEETVPIRLKNEGYGRLQDIADELPEAHSAWDYITGTWKRWREKTAPDSATAKEVRRRMQIIKAEKNYGPLQDYPRRPKPLPGPNRRNQTPKTDAPKRNITPPGRYSDRKFYALGETIPPGVKVIGVYKNGRLIGHRGVPRWKKGKK